MSLASCGSIRRGEPGASPQESWHPQKSTSAESAIHFRPILFHRSPHAQSLSRVILHIIFSTKDREPWLGLDVRPRMHAYLATVCRDLGTEVVRVGGVADHVHIVTTLPRTVSQADLVEQIKKTFLKSLPK